MATKTIERFGFHNYKDALRNSQLTWIQLQDFTYTFENFFHPFVSELIQQVNRASVPGLLDPNYQQSLTTEFFDSFYTELTNFLTHINHFPKEIDLRDGSPYANYNWELLFHIPLTIAVHLSKNQRFAEAQRWFHFIFDPTCTDTSVPTPQRFWKFLAFRKADGAKQIDELLTLLSKPDAECSAAEQELKGKILLGYEAIKDNPFQPHAVARTRQIAYQYCVVMKYLDNLIAWGDSLFRQDTIESINEATQIYVLAANLLGERPQRIPSAGKVQPKTFAQLKAKGLDAMGNALVELEGKFPLNLGLPQTQVSDSGGAGPLFGIGRTLYFCIPRNDKLLGYWDTVGDRLFKIRHCLNIEGVFRQLALFDPPIDPGMLVKAAAAGIDIGSAINGLNQPPSPVRSPLIIQKALELCAEVRSLGSALLSAIEKGEGEQLALLRQSHEIKIQQMSQDVRFLQWKQAQEATRSLLTSRATALERLHYYQRLLGLPADSNAPDTLPLDFEHLSLTEENFEQNYAALVGQYDKILAFQTLPNLTIAGGSSPTNQSGASGQGALYLNSKEDAELNTLLPTARDTGLAASVVEAVGTALVFIPDIKGNLHYWGLGGTVDIKIGTAITKSVEIAARILRMISVYNQEQANIAAKTASHERRADDWLLQYNLAAHELMQIGRQILTSLIAEQIAHHEYLTIQKQIEQSQEIERFLNEKFTNQELYAWMQGELSRLYYEYYRFAFDTARKAEQTMKRELMRPEVDATEYIKFNYWDGGRKGLLSGEALYLDVKRMEMAYHENNKRELELTKHISLLQVSPQALLQLRTTGSCTASLPEELFDIDGPGHYLRRIKTVAVTIPCVTGSYTSVNCTLTLLKSSIRKNALLKDGNYPREDSEDDRFIDSFGNLQSIVTSGGQTDSGLFETNLRDERYLPFEGLGVISEWKLELPANPSKGDPRPFDYDTITDVILHLRYTARDGGGLLKNGAISYLKDQIDAAQAVGSVRLFSLRHEFPTEWAKFKSAKIEGATNTAELTLNLRAEHYPFWSQGHLEAVKRLDFFAETVKNTVDISTNSDGTVSTDTLSEDAALGNLRTGKLTNILLPPPIGQFTLYFNDNSMEEIWMAVRWGKED
ncbi:toxin [Microcystis aeruginosa BLCCF158]|uniref:Toxin n=1 Tax=Microcystis aeruginosa BLCC-F158 TaxID=2755316 RepID=A0A841V2Z1_MICAE|nr:toxin [Microcystis aeruginosa]MBC1195384.1 toxin [Microcystis aeruginosa BLCC-F158]